MIFHTVTELQHSFLQNVCNRDGNVQLRAVRRGKFPEGSYHPVLCFKRQVHLAGVGIRVTAIHWGEGRTNGIG